MALPDVVVEHLQDSFVARTRPFCFLIDEHAVLLDCWGEGAWCRLEGIEPGTNMLEAAPYLHGMLVNESVQVEFITIATDVIVHLYVVPSGRRHYVILLDAAGEHAFLQQRQQTSNDMRLLHASQQRLIGRQRALIGELVEAKSELDHHRREAERSSSSKSRFIAMMSHEFRTPLASIINYADLALDEETGPGDVRKSLEAIGRSARHLTSLVEALLDDARLDAGQLELAEKAFNLTDLLTDLAAMMAPLAAEKGLSFATRVDADVPVHIVADEVRLRQILINLLGNAIKFTEDGGIELIITYHDSRLVATVADTGPGISAEDQEKVFRAFERGSASAATGAGLGLTITLRLAQLMGGEITLDSSPGQGCTVSLHLPVITSGAGHIGSDEILPAPDADVRATRPASILVCDDDEDMLALVEHYLHRAGYGLITTADGKEAIDKAIAYDPDLVLLDVNIPGVSGIEVACRLRSRGFAKPIVALTASKLSASEQAGFTTCFRKPAAMPALLAEIKRLTHAA